MARPPRFSEIGDTGLEHSAGQIHDEQLVQLRGRRRLKTLREMHDNDPTVGAIMFLTKVLIRRVPWPVETPNGGTQAERAKIHLEQCINDMSHTWGDTISDILTMVWAGFAPHEVVFKRRKGRTGDPRTNSRYNDNRIGIRKLPIRAPESISRWEIDDEDNGLRGLYQRTGGSKDEVFIPISKIVLFRTESNKNNPEGRSLLRNAFRPWYFKRRMEEIEAIGIERDLAGIPHMQVPQAYLADSKTDAQEQLLSDIEQRLESLRRDELASLITPAEIDIGGKPTGFKFQLVSTGGRRQIDTNEVIIRWDQRIAMTLIADLVMMGQQKVGTFSMFTGKTNLFTMAMEALVGQIREALNRFLIPVLMELNGWQESDWPRMATGPIQAPPMEELADFLQKLTKGTVLHRGPALEEFIRKSYGFPQETEQDMAEAERREEEERARAEAQLQQVEGEAADDTEDSP